MDGALATLTQLTDAVFDAVLLVDDEGRIRDLNSLAAALFGWDRDALRGQLVEVLIPEANRAGHVAARRRFHAEGGHRAMAGGGALPGRRKDGSEFIAQIGLGTMELDGQPFVLATVRDLSEQRREEEERRQFQMQLLQRQKLESLGVLAGGIAHDFNNLLTAIVGNTSLALVELPPESPARLSVREIERAAQRATELVRQMLAYAGKGHFVIEPLDLSSLIEEMAHLLQSIISKKAVLRFDLFRGLPPVNADATQIRQVVMNLITNASDAIGDRSGVISLRTGMVYANQHYLLDLSLADELSPGDYVFLEVSDNGCGMDDATRERIFDPFFSTKFSGRGLGLAAVQGIVRAHRGALKIYTEVSRGSTFKLLLSCAEQASLAVPGAGSLEEDWRGAGTILVVDDEESGRMLIRSILTRLGFHVLEAANGLEAIALYHGQHAEIRAVILDLTMPRMGGLDAFSELRRIREDAVVILMSGYSEQDVTTQFAGKGIAGFLQKPFTFEALRDMLRKALPEDPEA